MDARKNPEYLKSVAEAVTQFRAALVEFLELHVANEGFSGSVAGFAAAVLPRDGVDEREIARLREKVTRLAGRASAATPLTRDPSSMRGSVVIDPIQDWVTITRPKSRLVKTDVLDACDYALGHLDDLIRRAEADLPPSAGAEALHPAVRGLVARMWRDGRFRECVAAAAESVVGMVKARTGRDDMSVADLWRQTFSDEDPRPGQPRLRWPGDADEQDVRTMNSGLLPFASGVWMTICNSAAHPPDGLDEQAALERLSTLSLLARWIDECELVRTTADPTNPSTVD
ncbi:TIGR02391 family protein [Umezawaea sp. Da 62-37]|uniref:TIGR02391 family protein n=1 Tax=Umezawaea sp. Da 62-37 TaxID=3075927 RepID=UPI0028F6CAEF|nr:TIGR02391 family protein [Umezawaea sp. Da 62-37]WNV87530.1 TIGR02391 family protein [Umezawaea sp. Da 62-37]